jgi:CBS domain containing-hemolysin-like protein
MAAALAALPGTAHASHFEGETLDTIANVLAWVVLIVAPVIGLAVFWMVHILPEKIAEKRNHPQAKAIQVVCLLSLVFGGMLWPIAWLWAYSKPVLYKLAYGTDQGDHAPAAQAQPAGKVEEEGERDLVAYYEKESEKENLARLRARVSELEAQLASAARKAKES